MRVTIGQINTTSGDYEGNTASILRALEQARHCHQRGAQTGYRFNRELKAGDHVRIETPGGGGYDTPG
jgi:N-methylhydantoinase B/oxoprolinase/acetone carboxylase alpha subunit